MDGLMYPKIQTKKKRKKHHESIIHDKKEHTCYLCMLLHNNYQYYEVLHEHHIFGGPDRDKSEEYGLKVSLCIPHHEYGPEAVHTNAEINNVLHCVGQTEFEKEYGHERFMAEFRKNYL